MQPHILKTSHILPQLDAQLPAAIVAEILTGHGIRQGMLVKKGGEICCTHPALEFLIPIVSSSTEWRDHEALFIAVDNETQCLYIVAVHSSKRGRPEGGARLKLYETFGQAIDDCLRLAFGMTMKNAVADIWEGGAKSVIIPYSSEVFLSLMEQQGSQRSQIGPDREKLWANFGAFVASLHGLYLVGEDVNLNSADMAAILSYCVHTSCLGKEFGGSGNPSPYTAAGVFKAIQATIEMVFPDAPSMFGKQVLVKGLGNVGYSLVEQLIEAGAHVIAYDPSNRKAKEKAIEQFTADRITIIEQYEQFISTPADVFSPNANSLSINRNDIDQFNVKIICGAENGQLEDLKLAEKLHQQGIVYIPETWINYMGVFSAYQEHRGILESEFAEKINSIYAKTKIMLVKIKETNVSTYQYVANIAQLEAQQEHPLEGHRGIKIIDELFAEWENEAGAYLVADGLMV